MTTANSIVTIETGLEWTEFTITREKNGKRW